MMSGFSELAGLPWERITDKIERRILAGKHQEKAANRDMLAQVLDLDMATRLLTAPGYTPQPVRDSHGRFQTGNKGGPGRPLGSRNKLSEDFIAAIYDNWNETRSGSAGTGPKDKPDRLSADHCCTLPRAS
jgi:hypothetical protein